MTNNEHNTLSSTSLATAPVYNAAAAAVYTSNYRDLTAGSNGVYGNISTAAAD